MNKNKKSSAVACFSIGMLVLLNATTALTLNIYATLIGFGFVGTAVLCVAGTLVLFIIRPPKRPEPETAGDIDEEALPVPAVE